MGVWGEKTHKCHGVSKARKLSVTVVITWLFPQTCCWPGGSDKNSGLRKCLENSRQVCRALHPAFSSRPRQGRWAGLESGEEGTSSLHPGVGLDQNARAEPYEPPEGSSSQSRPPCTLATSLCILERHPQGERQTLKSPPVKVSELQKGPLLRGQPGPSPRLHDSAGSFPSQLVSTRGQAHHAPWAPRN